jgi:ribosome-associated protein
MTQQKSRKESSKKAAQSPQGGSTVENPILDQALTCAKAAIDKRAENLKVLDLTQISGFTDYFVICSGTSDRQVQSIADGIEKNMKDRGARLLSNEGYSEGRWVLMDYGHIVIHIFLDALRDYYDLERLWTDAPQVKIPAEFYGPAASPAN